MAALEPRMSVDMTPRVSVDMTCGIGNFRPKWMRRLATPKMFLANFSIMLIVQGAYGAYLIGNTSTLEKRFAFSSKLTGFILIADNLSQLVINPVIGYLGTRVNKSKLMAVGMMMISVSCWMTGVPYLFYGANEIHQNVLLANETRRLDENTEYCSAANDNQCGGGNIERSTVWPAYITIFMASFLNGIGNCAIFTLGVPYLDDNVSKRNAPLYFSITACIRLFGPAGGFLLSSWCLSMYENPTINPGYGPKDPRWVGAWWLGFFIIGTLIFLASLPLFLFPKQLKQPKGGRKAVKAKVVGEPVSTTQDVIQSLKRLASNKILVYDTISRAFTWIGMGGYYISQPKYLESQYNTSASKASLFTGTTSVVALAIGLMTGGVIVRIFRPGPRVLTIYMFVVGLASFSGIMSGLFLGCPRREFAETGTDLSSINLFSSTCNSDCSCSQHVFQPVCSSDGKTNYFSPCAAGCTGSFEGLNAKNVTSILGYTGCGCEGGDMTVTKGYCKTDCGSNLGIYITLISIGKLISSTSFAGSIMIKLRCVEPKDKSFAIGITKTILALGASIPYPLLFGAITDSTCLIWDKSSCGKKGNCWFYDSDKMRSYLHISSISFIVLGSFFDLFVIYYADTLKNLYGQDDDKDDDEDDDDPESVKGKLMKLNGLATGDQKSSQNEKPAVEGNKESASKPILEAKKDDEKKEDMNVLDDATKETFYETSET